jgi:ferric-dicitrate binding protein FerR (iron transport regulator)
MDDRSLDILWQHVLDHWDEEASHRAFLAQAEVTGQLAEAAARYRAASARHERGPMARRQLAAVTTLALMRLEASRSLAPRRRRPRAIWVPLVLLVAGMAALFAYLRLLSPGLGP